MPIGPRAARRTSACPPGPNPDPQREANSDRRSTWRFDGVYFLVSGAVSLQMVRDGQVSEIATIQAGEFCGETGMYGHQAANMRAVALEDTVAVVIAPDVVRYLFEASPRLASDTGHTLEVHRKALQSARTVRRQHRSG